MKKLLIIAFLVLFGSLFSQKLTAEKADDIFSQYSVDEILRYRSQLQGQIKTNQKESSRLSKLGLKVNRNILTSQFSIGTNQDAMLLRLAEYTIERAEENYELSYDNYDNEYALYLERLDKFEADSANSPPPGPEPTEPNVDYSGAIDIYDRIINEFSGGEYVDDAMYAKAYHIQRMDKEEEANQIYKNLISQYPNSDYTPKAIMALAQYYFQDRVGKSAEQNLSDLNLAIKYYEDALKYKDSKEYDQALYYLGWSYFRLAVTDPEYYKKAILNFLRVVDDVNTAKIVDPNAEYSEPAVENEAVKYIGISYQDPSNPAGGAANLKKLVNKLIELKKPYAAKIMRSLGDVYYEIREDQKAIEAYTAMQELFPFYKDGAEIQQKIVESYRGSDADYEYVSESVSFEERYKLFKKYNSKSDWYNQVISLDIPNKFEIINKAEKNAEEALSTNISILFQDSESKVQEGKATKEDYLKLVQMCEEFLEFFPTSDFSFRIHSNMARVLDRRLQEYERAYEEFIVASNEYPDENFDKIVEVAYEAVIVADTLWAIDGGKKIKPVFNANDSVVAEDLSIAEKRMVEAYENYIKISPDDSNSAIFLSAIGGIYFNKKQFNNANKYLRTLLTRFPGSNGQSLARVQLMNSYYARGQFLSSESVARKIINDEESLPEDIVSAKLRFADAITKNAETFQKQGKHFVAGMEYRRVAEEAEEFEERPSYINKVLMNSGNQFDLVGEQEQAIKSYNMVMDRNDKFDSYYYKALINTAFDYGELNQKRKSAELYEVLYFDYPDSTDAKKYLSNAGAYYEQSKSWKDAIRVNYQYANLFPEDPQSKDILFQNAGLYLKLDDIDNANKIYDDFTAKYPDDVRVVQAYTEKGKYYLGKGDIPTAKSEFQKAIDKNDEFRKADKENDFYAAEAAFELIQLQEKEYDAIRFKWPQQNIERQKVVKRDMRNILVENYKRLILYRSPRSFQAPYKMAEVFERFADTYVEQDVDPSIKDEILRFSAESAIRNSGAKLYEDAIDRYKNAIVQIKEIADKYDVDLDDSNNEQAEEEIAVKPDSVQVIERDVTKKLVNADSVRSIANRWVDASKEKVTSIVFQVALQSEENIAQALNVKVPPQFEKFESQKLQFKSKVISDAVELQVEKSIEAHRRNLETSKELDISNKYIEESKRRIVLNRNIIADEFNKLAKQSLNLFTVSYSEYIKLIPKPYDSRSPVLKKTYQEINDDIENFLELATDFTTKTLQAYQKTIETAKQDSIVNDLTEFTELSILNGPLEYAKIIDDYADSIKLKKKEFSDTYDKYSTSEKDAELDLALNFEDGKNHLENYSLSVTDNKLLILDEAYLLANDMNLPKTSSYNLILKKLIKMDPITYGDKIPRHEVIVLSDDTWKVSKTYSEGWTDTAYNDSLWKKPLVLNLNDSLKITAFDTLQKKPTPIFYADKILTREEVDSTNILNLPQSYLDTLSNQLVYYNEDTLGNRVVLESDTVTGYPVGFQPEYAIKTIEFSADTTDSANIFFRKKLTLDGKLHSARYMISADGETDFFFNSQLINIFELPTDTFDTGTQALFGQNLLKIGTNQISLNVRDYKLPRHGLRFYLRLEILPKEFSSDEEEFIDDTTILSKNDERKVQLYIKNRLNTDPVADNYILKNKTTDEQKTDEQKTDEQKTDEQKTDEQKTDEQKTDEQKTDEQKTDEQKTDEQKTDEQKTDEQKTDEQTKTLKK